jgi:hypothetical protein
MVLFRRFSIGLTIHLVYRSHSGMSKSHFACMNHFNACWSHSRECSVSHLCVSKSECVWKLNSACINHTHECQTYTCQNYSRVSRNHILRVKSQSTCGNRTLCVEINLVRVKITLVRVGVTLMRVLITLICVKITLCV